MEEKAKERVFGVVILVALSVIFIPMWFNTTVGDSAKLDRDISSMPSWPQSEELLLPSERLLPTAQTDSPPVVPTLQENLSISEENVPSITALVSVPELVTSVVTTPVAVVASQEPAVAPTVVSVAPVEKSVAKTAAVSVKKTVATAKVAQKTDLAKGKTTLANTAKTKTKASGQSLMAYTVQLGNFENQANAQKLARSLRAAGYTAYVSDNYAQGKDLKKVMVGPQSDRRDAEKVISKLEGQYKLKGFIVKYDPRD